MKKGFGWLKIFRQRARRWAPRERKFDCSCGMAIFESERAMHAEQGHRVPEFAKGEWEKREAAGEAAHEHELDAAGELP
jgi:hypothetical protein